MPNCLNNLGVLYLWVRSHMSELYDVFISYGRADSKGFAKKLCQKLTANGYRVWLDLNDIPLGVNYQSQIDTDLERSHRAYLKVRGRVRQRSRNRGKEVIKAVIGPS